MWIINAFISDRDSEMPLIQEVDYAAVMYYIWHHP